MFQQICNQKGKIQMKKMILNDVGAISCPFHNFVTYLLNYLSKEGRRKKENPLGN